MSCDAAGVVDPTVNRARFLREPIEHAREVFVTVLIGELGMDVPCQIDGEPTGFFEGFGAASEHDDFRARRSPCAYRAYPASNDMLPTVAIAGCAA